VEVRAVAVFPASHEVKVSDHQDPRISHPDQVKLRILDVGICGTDKEICNFEYGTPPPGDDYLVIGHEALAEVVEVGTAVERLQPGDLVVPSVRRPCPIPAAGRADPGIRTTAIPATSENAASKKHTAT
jgi:threonine dehydrogenase-like Zn-dependent dehydrogenase